MAIRLLAARSGTVWLSQRLADASCAPPLWAPGQRHRINSFYTAPTAIRALMKFGTDPVKKYDKSSLRVLGSVGEPINPEAWRWYFEEVGEKRCVVVDTFWQTETGGHMITNLPGCTPMKPGAAPLPMIGVRPVVVDPTSGEVVAGNGVEGVLCVSQPWPGIARTIWGDHERRARSAAGRARPASRNICQPTQSPNGYLATYLKPTRACTSRATAAAATRMATSGSPGGWTTCSTSSGHRLGTAEIESALVAHPACVRGGGHRHPARRQGTGRLCVRSPLRLAAAATPSHRAPSRPPVAGTSSWPRASPTRPTSCRRSRCATRSAASPSPTALPSCPACPRRAPPCQERGRRGTAWCLANDSWQHRRFRTRRRSGKIMRRVLRKIACNESDQLGDVFTLADPSIVTELIAKVEAVLAQKKKQSAPRHLRALERRGERAHERARARARERLGSGPGHDATAEQRSGVGCMRGCTSRVCSRSHGPLVVVVCVTGRDRGGSVQFHLGLVTEKLFHERTYTDATIETEAPPGCCHIAAAAPAMALEESVARERVPPRRAESLRQGALRLSFFAFVPAAPPPPPWPRPNQPRYHPKPFSHLLKSSTCPCCRRPRARHRASTSAPGEGPRIPPA